MFVNNQLYLGATQANMYNDFVQIDGQTQYKPESSGGQVLLHPAVIAGGLATSQSPWILRVYSGRIDMDRQRIHKKRRRRGALSQRPTIEIVHDLLSNSFLPLTEQQADVHGVHEQVEVFMSAFDEKAIWTVDTTNLPHHIGKVIFGSTPNARNPSVIYRFLRFRFPMGHFEWFVQSPYGELDRSLRAGTLKTVFVKALWRLWAKEGASPGLVAYGSVTDEIGITTDGFPVIIRRNFCVTRVFQPELITPIPYPRRDPPLERPNDLLIFSTSQSVIQHLRSFQQLFTLLAALSASFASLQPVVSYFNPAIGWVFVAMGVTSGVISVLAVVVSWMLKWVESHSAGRKQRGASTENKYSKE